MRKYSVKPVWHVFLAYSGHYLGCTCLHWCANQCLCADIDHLGTLSLAVQDDVAAKLQLSDEQKTKLNAELKDREDKYVDLVMQSKGLSDAEQEQKISSFRRESEAKGKAILTQPQQNKLEQIRTSRLGMASLAEPAVSSRLALTDPQKTQVTDLIAKSKKELEKADETTARSIKAETERGLAALLTKKQKAEWESMTSNGSSAESPTPVAEISQSSPAVVSKQEQPTATTAELAEKPAQSTQKAAAAAAQSHAEIPEHPEKIRFKFRYQPWKEVIDWFAQKANYSLVMDSPPPGTFNYTDDREFTPTEALDLLNSVLLTKGYTLVRHERMLMLFNIEEGPVPDNFVPNVPLDSLDKHAESEMVKVIFNLENLTPEEVASEVEKLKGPQTSIVVLSKSRQLKVTDTVANLRMIRGVVQKLIDPQGIRTGQLRTYNLRFVTPEEILPMLRQMLDIPEGQFKTADGSLLLAVDTNNKRLLATGKTERLSRLEDVLKLIDAPKGGGSEGLLDGHRR